MTNSFGPNPPSRNSLESSANRSPVIVLRSSRRDDEQLFAPSFFLLPADRSTPPATPSRSFISSGLCIKYESIRSSRASKARTNNRYASSRRSYADKRHRGQHVVLRTPINTRTWIVVRCELAHGPRKIDGHKRENIPPSSGASACFLPTLLVKTGPQCASHNNAAFGLFSVEFRA